MAKNDSIFLFCIPGEIYKGKSIEEVAKNYTKMAIEEYDSFVTFDPIYEPYKQIPDMRDFALKKEDRKIFRNLFLHQQMTRVGEIYGLVNSSSHLFNPEYSVEDLFLPDLDVVEFHGRKISQAQEIKKFYESNGWKVCEYYETIRRSIWIARKGRFSKAQETVSVKSLLRIAEEKFGYNPKKLCWA